MPDTPLTLLLVEDQEDDVLMIARVLKKSGFDLHYHHVDTASAMAEALKTHTIDAIICDHSMPSFGSIDALEILRDSGQDLPFIIVSGMIDDQSAVAAMKAGAHDYVLKDNLTRLVPALYRELHEAAIRAEHRKTTDELRLKEQDLRQIINNIVIGILIIDEQGRILSINPSACNIFGYQEQELVGQNIQDCVPAPHQDTTEDYMSNFLMSGQHASPIRELLAEHKSGTLFPLHVAINELPSSNEERRFICSCMDISKQKLQEEQLRRTQKMDALGKLTGGIAHDYNNMLGIILGYADMLQHELADNERLSRLTDHIVHAGERGAKLTRKLLTFSKVQASNTDVTDINRILKDTRHMLNTTLTARIQLTLDLNDQLWTTLLDKSDLEDATINLCINAAHAMPDGGQLTLSTDNQVLDETDCVALEISPGDYVAFSITDTGTGIDNDTINKIFDPFYTTKAEKGTGLGLSQVYSFVHRSRGTITVDSEPGQGTRFTLYFPRHGDSHQPAETDEIQGMAKTQGSECILVVDDEPELATLVSHILNNAGYRTLIAHNADEALAELQQQHVDLVISDIIMPGLDGYQLATKIKELQPDIKIQLVSGFTDNLQRNQRDDALHQNILYKPFKALELLQHVRKLLDN